MEPPPIRIAILDMYRGEPNQGMRGIRTLIFQESRKAEVPIRWHRFEVRTKSELPDLSYHIYISSGGPGSPLAGDGPWETPYFKLIDEIWEHNQKSEQKKYVFFICHSFQLICRHWKVGLVSKRKSPAFGVFPVHKTEEGREEPLFEGLEDPFYVTESREYQVTQPNQPIIQRHGFRILALEKERPHVSLERALMAIRFSNEFFGTQFHPEADPYGMVRYFTQPDKRQSIIRDYGEEKYYRMIDMLDDPDKLIRTQRAIIPTFLRMAFDNVMQTADCT
ncbi:MAG: GMP synthase [Chitinophagales bacterium]|nr:GMP synthase [Chitinophagales bacterium]MDW8427338.1 GMP synthase [Chitinophagales bacterium]